MAEISREQPREPRVAESVCLKGVDDGRVLARDRVVVEPHRAALGLVRHLPQSVQRSVTPSHAAGPRRERARKASVSCGEKKPSERQNAPCLDV